MTRGLIIASIALIAGFALVACQSYDDGIAALCNSPSTCEECSQVVPEMRPMTLSQHIDDVVKNGRANDLYQSFAEIDNPERVQRLREAAAEVGLEECLLADMFAGEPYRPEK